MSPDGPLRVGLVGSDGRTDALAEHCTRSGSGASLWALSGFATPGLATKCGVEGFSIVDDPGDPRVIERWAAEVEPSLVIVGPEDPLARGAVDALTAAGVDCFGPVAALARIEASKAWARQLVDKYVVAGQGIEANPEYRIFETTEGLEEHLRSRETFVVKPDGLTGGKGVRLYPEHFESLDEAVAYAASCIDAGGLVLVEERLEGEELSLMTITDGESVVHCPPVQDHKRSEAGDTGPNTGGMGSYSDADHSLPFLVPAELEAARRINEVVIEAMASETGERYRGVLYGGFMVTGGQTKLIEYNCRFGDPEALNVMPILEGDFVEVASAVARGRLSQVDVGFQRKATVCKYVVPAGYPGGKGKGDPIEVPEGLADEPGVHLYWAAAELGADGTTTMTGSRALGVVGIGDDLASAEAIAEGAAARVGGPVRHRSDIGTAALVQRRVDHMAQLRAR